MSARTWSNQSILHAVLGGHDSEELYVMLPPGPPPPIGMKRPALAIRATRPAVFNVTVLPPVFGPELVNKIFLLAIQSNICGEGSRAQRKFGNYI